MLLRWTLTGIWSEETVRDFATALMRQILIAERESMMFGSVSDCSAYPEQAPAVLESLNAFANLAIGKPGRKVAIITGRPLTRKQALRAESGELLQVFATEQAALAWLGGVETRTAA